jgi:hypothetical protein
VNCGHYCVVDLSCLRGSSFIPLLFPFFRLLPGESGDREIVSPRHSIEALVIVLGSLGAGRRAL